MVNIVQSTRVKPFFFTDICDKCYCLCFNLAISQLRTSIRTLSYHQHLCLNLIKKCYVETLHSSSTDLWNPQETASPSENVSLSTYLFKKTFTKAIQNETKCGRCSWNPCSTDIFSCLFWFSTPWGEDEDTNWCYSDTWHISSASRTHR